MPPVGGVSGGACPACPPITTLMPLLMSMPVLMAVEPVPMPVAIQVRLLAHRWQPPPVMDQWALWPMGQPA